ncbi:MAG: outer membrane beta-barrel protein [Hyphomicrobiaceae bacterium]
MTRFASQLRLLSGTSLLVLALGHSAVWAQTAPSTPADLRGSVDAVDVPADAETEPSAPQAESLRDGDIPVALEPAPPADEATNADAQANPDGTLAADGQADAIVEASEADLAEDGAIPAEPVAGVEASDAGEGNDPPPQAQSAVAEEPSPPSVDPALRPAYPENADNPYAPIGYRLGSFVLFPEIGSEVLFDDNLFRSGSNRISDRALGLREGLRVTSDWSRHALEADVAAYQSFYQDYSSENDRTIDAALRGRVDITADTILDGTLGYALAQESRGTIDFPTGATERPDVTDRSASLALTQRFNRLTARLRGAVSDSAREGLGIDASEDYLERGIGLRVGYEVSPGLQLFAEQDWSRRDYEAPAADGLLRDADGRVTRIGAAAELTAKITGELSIGKLVEQPDADALASIEGLVADGALTWTPSALTTVTFAAHSTIAPTSVAGSAGALERSADVGVRHEFRRYLAAIAGLGYTSRDYAGTDIGEDEVTGNLGLEYLVGRGWVIGGGYQHTQFESSEPESDYTDNVFRLTGGWRP